MGEVVVGLLQLVSIGLAKWLLPVVSVGRVVLTPPDAAVRPWSLSPLTSLPSGQTGVDVDFAAAVGSFVLLSGLVVGVILLCSWLG